MKKALDFIIWIHERIAMEIFVRAHAEAFRLADEEADREVVR